MGSHKLLTLLTGMVVMHGLINCAGPKIRPPETKAVAQAQLKKLAVLPFEGIGGLTFSTELEDRFAHIMLGDKPALAVIPWSQIDPILNEMRLLPTEPIAPSTAIELGGRVEAEGVLIGKIIKATVYEDRYTERKKTCEQEGLFNQCQAGTEREVEVPCVRKTAEFTVNPRFIAVETGKILYDETVTQQVTVQQCGVIDVGYDDYEMLKKVRQKIINIIQCHIAPCYQDKQYKFNLDGLHFFR